MSIPNAWIIGALAVGHFRMGLDAAALDTLALVALVFGSQTTLHAFRERRRLWSRPGLWLVLAAVKIPVFKRRAIA